MRSETHRTIDAVWRIESARLIAGLARMVRDVGLAEELAQDALVAALEQWPESGVPDNPGAWLMATAKHRAIDRFADGRRLERKHEELGQRARAAGGGRRARTSTPRSTTTIGDDLLRLIFIACHPVLSTEARVALTLRLLGGLTTDEIARAFLVVRADGRPADRPGQADAGRGAGPVRGPRAARSWRRRLASVLEVIYLIFNEGYSATAGDDWMRPALCEDALRLGRILAELAPSEPEVHGLVALMEIQASRSRARVGPTGEPILLLDQDRARWDRCSSAAGSRRSPGPRRSAAPLGPYALQAAIAACHARARSPGDTDWVAHRRALRRARPASRRRRSWSSTARSRSAMAFGPAAGLELVDALAASRRWPATTCCRACAATCSPSSAASTRRGPSSSAPPR